MYGSKDVWYLHSIETKNYIAIFSTSAREDGQSVSGINGGGGLMNLEKLDKIELFTREGLRNASPTPIKTVHFEYNYQLCPGIPNGSTGKLTLTNIYFTYGKSNKGKLNSYRFNYDNINPKYNLKGYDRWGYFKPNPGTADYDIYYETTHSEDDFCSNICLNGNCTIKNESLPPNNQDFPYTEQNRQYQDDFASAWAMSSIDLPSGGRIAVNYEADDYAFVQDKRAAQMFKILGAGNTNAYSNRSSQLFNKALSDQDKVFDYLFFKKSNSTDDPAIYTRGIKNLYFKFLMKLGSKGNKDFYEYVPGYVELDGDAINASDNTAYGCVKIKSVKVQASNNTPANPISKASWQFTKQYLPRLAYNQSELTQTGAGQLIKALVGSLTAVTELVTGFNTKLFNKNFSRNFVAGRSWIRLNHPNMKKLGGGVRVKKVEIFDNWAAQTNNNGITSSYGQEYDYKINDPVYGDISSGVAAYEPIIGGDENPLRQPINYNVEKRLAEDDAAYIEEPVSESYFPAPVVGYSKVTVRNLQYANVKRSATGYVEHEFYTARDFPVVTRYTDAPPAPFKSRPLFALFKTTSVDHQTVTQGFSVELNDMHGKPKSQQVYQEDKPESPISSVKYNYKMMANNDKRLDNNAEVIMDDGTIVNTNVGIDYEAFTDAREQITVAFSSTISVNGDLFVLGIIPAAIPAIFPTTYSETMRFRSMTFTKIINRFGLLESSSY